MIVVDISKVTCDASKDDSECEKVRTAGEIGTVRSRNRFNIRIYAYPEMMVDRFRF